jgi:hypothetical protein
MEGAPLTLAAIAVFLSVMVNLLGTLLISYYTEKGKNLATKEDIAAITSEVARVNHRYNELVEELRARNQMRMAAIDRRLEVHQKSFTLWRELVVGKNVDDAATACSEFYNANCLYLEGGLRQAFVDAFTNAVMHRDLLKVSAGHEAIAITIAKLMAYPDILFSAIKLPPMSESEHNLLRPKGTQV